MNKKHILPLIIISLLTILALVNLEAFPIFADEAIYLFWAHKIMHGMAHPFISLYDGKPPLFMWFSGISFLFSSNLLLAGRIISVLSLTTILILTFFTLQKQSRSWAYISVILIALSPFVFFHTRLALIDSLFSVFLLASVLSWSHLPIKYKGIVTGLLIGLAFWTKTPALFIIPFPLISALLISRSKNNIKQAMICILFTLVMIGSLRVSIWFPFLFNRAGDFSYSLKEILSGQTQQIGSNTVALLTWLIHYRLWPVILTSIVGLIIGIKKKNSLIINLLIAALCFIIPFLIFGKVLAPRYYLFLGLVIPILAAYGLSHLSLRISVFITSLTTISFIPFIYTLISQPLKINLPQVDKGQYLQNWASGIGIKESADFFIQNVREGKVKVLSEGYFGTLPDGLFVEISNRMEGLPIEIVGVGDNNSPTYFRELKNSTADNIYYIGNHDRIDLINRPELKLILSFPKVDEGPALEVYQINL